MAVTAFLAALFGGIVAPMVTEGFRALGEFEMPDIQFPEIKKKGSKGRRISFLQWVNKLFVNFSGREFDEPMKPVSSLFKLAAEKMIESALTRLQKHQ